MSSGRHLHARNHRSKTPNYIGLKIGEYKHGEEQMGPIAAFAAAYKKAQGKSYDFSKEQKYGTEAHAAMSAVHYSAPTVTVHFQHVLPGQPKKPITIGADFSQKTLHEQGHTFSIESDATTSVYLNGNNVEIPKTGTITVRIAAKSDDPKLPNIDKSYSHLYDLDYGRTSTENPLAHHSSHFGASARNSINSEIPINDEIDGNIYGFSANLHPEACEKKRLIFNLPCARLSFSAKHLPKRGGAFVLRDVGLACNYRGETEYVTTHGKQCCSTSLGPMLSPGCYDGSCGMALRVPHKCGNFDHPYYLEKTQLQSRDLIPERIANLGGFSAAFEDLIKSKYAPLLGDCSIIVKHQSMGQLYKTPGCSGKKYRISQVTKLVTAVSFFKIAEHREITWQRIKHDPMLLPEILGPGTPLCTALASIFKLPEDLSTSEHNHYVRTSSGSTSGVYDGESLDHVTVRWPTLFQLLSDTSGLSHSLEINIENALGLYSTEAQETSRDPEERLVDFLNQNPQKLIFTPGSVVHPSQLSYVILGHVLERMCDNHKSIEEILLETAKQLGMGDVTFYSDEKESIKNNFGRAPGIYTPAFGLIASVSDIESLVQAHFSENGPLSKYLKRVMIPRFGISHESPAAQCMGGHVYSPLFDKQTKKFLFTTLDNCGYYPSVGNGVRMTFIPEYQLSATLCVQGQSAERFRKLASKLVLDVVGCYRKVVLGLNGPVSDCPNRQPMSELINPCGLPPLYFHTLRSHDYTDPSYADKKIRPSFSFRANILDTAYHASPCGLATQSCGVMGDTTESPESVMSGIFENGVVLTPLYSAVRFTDELVVAKVKGTGRYVLQFVPSIPQDITDKAAQMEFIKSRCIVIHLAQDPSTGHFRVLHDGLMREHIQIYFGKTQLGNPIYGISVFGVPYFVNRYVESLQNQLKESLLLKHAELSGDVYGAHSESLLEKIKKTFIGARFAGSVLGGLALGATLGGAAALGSYGGYPYGGYYDPYYDYPLPIWAGSAVFPRRYYGGLYGYGGGWRGSRIGGGHWGGGRGGWGGGRGGWGGGGRRIREAIDDSEKAIQHVQQALSA